MGQCAREQLRPGSTVLMARRDTGFPADVKAVITERAGGMCEIMLLGCGMFAVDTHHRVNRGMGTAEKSGGPSAALAVCRHCHDWIGRNPSDAYELGYLVRRNSIVTPAESRVWWRSSRWLYLDDFGGMRTA